MNLLYVDYEKAQFEKKKTKLKQRHMSLLSK